MNAQFITLFDMELNVTIVLLPPINLNSCVTEVRGREMVFKSRRYFRRQLVGIPTVAKKLVGIKLDIFGTSKH